MAPESAKQELTDAGLVFTLPGPSKGQTERLYMDRSKDRARGLGLRVREDQSRTWLFLYRFGGSQRRITIGAASKDPSGWTFKKAQSAARGFRVKVDNGADPKTERDERHAAARVVDGAKTLGETAEAFLDAREPNMKPRSFEEVARHLRVQFKPLHRHSLHLVTPDMIADQLDVIEKESGPTARNRARSSLSAMYAWAISQRHSRPVPTSNPVGATGKAEEGGGRERTLTDAELAAIWKAAPENGYGRIVRLLMLTAQRREEIGGLRWSEIDGDLISLPAERTKNSRPHDVHLSSMARNVLAGVVQIKGRDLVFGEGTGGYSGWSRSKETLDAKCKVKNWTLHDLRRTAATRMADLGVQPHVIEAVLNHVSGHKAGVAGIYNRSTYAAERKAALDLWAGHLKLILAKSEGANVTRLRQRN